MFGKRNRDEAGVTLVATNCELVGDIHFNDQLLINGVVKGNIYAQSGSKAQTKSTTAPKTGRGRADQTRCDSRVSLDSGSAGSPTARQLTGVGR